MSDSKNMTNEELEGRAQLEADADSTAVEETSINDRIPYVVELSRAYDDMNGGSIREIDLSRLQDLTTLDAEYIERVMDKMGHHPADRFRDTTYTKHVAMRVTGFPVELFNALNWKDMRSITARVAVHFLA